MTQEQKQFVVTYNSSTTTYITHALADICLAAPQKQLFDSSDQM